MTTASLDALRAFHHENLRLKRANEALENELRLVRKTLRALRDLYGHLENVGSQTDVVGLIRQILAEALEAVNSENGSLQLLDDYTGELVFVEVQSPLRAELLGYRLPPGVGIAGEVVSRRKPMLVPDAQREPLFSPMVDQSIGFQTQSLLCVPLIDHQRTLGVIEVVNSRSGEPLTEQDLDIMLLVAHIAAAALVRAERVSLPKAA